MTKHIMVVEDDLRLSKLIQEYLQQNGFQVTIENRGDRAIQGIEKNRPDALILDLMLPGMDGFNICQEIRGNFQGPIMILTARDDDMDQVAGLEIGADDYVKKPVAPRVVLARIRALLRRFNNAENADSPQAEGVQEDELCFGGLKISRQAYQVYLNDQPVDLTRNEFELLWILASNAGQVLDRERLMAGIRGVVYDGLDRSVDVTVSRLRRKLGDDAAHPSQIKTVWGQGYLFVINAC
jgi:DNA-binding response OmpR family regulator